MSGHNKWSSIKNKKGKEDAKRGKIFTKLARYITVAAREGGSDPEYNPTLKAAIDKAKAENMPNDNINRAIKKATGSEASDNFERVIYEGYAVGGVAVIVECLTDNKNRTASNIRHLFDKFGGNLGTDGSVMYMFNRKGLLITKDKSADFDLLMMSALEAGCEDVTEEDDHYEIITSVENFNDVRNALLKDYDFEEADISYIADNYISLDEDKISTMVKLLENLEDDDDVQEVYSNWDGEGIDDK
ncbi:MAG: YebC/PmpR family DNA-binding transcriptional regulator [Tissierellia bacterium]|nr:YebC/PmpR family DNA-binding transcriptional regulator [Tissierellia bacterium]